tara:strand:+ start:5279 stop:5413 length:135 start_codon:yes stop_codon:yes gene_type:complete
MGDYECEKFRYEDFKRFIKEIPDYTNELKQLKKDINNLFDIFER